ncbi:anti-sigma factor [Tabrizicola sp. J26]|uniref:anti-sigma factor n=1 Tax=Alitabrizicola rongguiensis TaxID=2909234 RepID=UPI001F3B0B79|nr:anti-sigma factor [Tabrizicola rongguiensis]MCF1710116.1 anti-sigma factor [Tabrizicola rongguiensis]
MSDRDLPPPDDDPDALAAEYVLGLLDPAGRAAAEARIRIDAGFAALVDQWTERLAPLNAGFAPVPPPDLLPRIEARLFPALPRRRWAGWRFLAGVVTAAMVGLAILVFSGPPAPPGPILTAELRAETQPLLFEARYDGSAGTVTLTRRSGAGAEAGRDYELWSIGADGIPASLGLLRGEEITLPAPALGPGMVLAVSLEPAGGSTTGQPTGPVLVTGALING